MATLRLLVIDAPPPLLPAAHLWTAKLSEGVRLEVAETLDDARLRLARDGFDLLVMAWDGEAQALQRTLGELRALSPSLAIVLATRHDDETVEDVALTCGAHEWLPLAGVENPDVIIAAARRALARAHAAHATAMDDWLVPGQRFGSLGVLTSAAASDIGNMLRMMGDNMRTVAGELPPSTSGRDYLDEAIAASLRAAELSRQMQTFSRTRRSGFEKLSLAAVVREVNQLLRVARGSHIHLRYELAADAPFVFADRALVSQMLVNLVMNACESIGPHREGTVTIGVSAARASAEDVADAHPQGSLDEGDYATLWIADTGSGMTLDVAQRAFEPLFSTKAEGRGLGLPASLRIAVSHGGGIRVQTSPAGGTTVTVFLPPHFAA